MVKGFSLIEVVISFFILSVGLTGFLTAENHAYQQVKIIHQKILNAYSVA
jgi:prepilin-type N-terminal cleavage/methylation domain-containing protein